MLYNIKSKANPAPRILQQPMVNWRLLSARLVCAKQCGGWRWEGGLRRCALKSNGRCNNVARSSVVPEQRSAGVRLASALEWINKLVSSFALRHLHNSASRAKPFVIPYNMSAEKKKKGGKRQRRRRSATMLLHHNGAHLSSSRALSIPPFPTPPSFSL